MFRFLNEAIIGTVIKINDVYYHIIHGNNLSINSISLFNPENDTYLRHYFGEVIPSSKPAHNTDDPNFNADSSFIPELSPPDGVILKCSNPGFDGIAVSINRGKLTISKTNPLCVYPRVLPQIGDTIEFFNQLFKICPANNDLQEAFSLNLKKREGAFLRHSFGKLVIDELDPNAEINTFNDDTSYLFIPIDSDCFVLKCTNPGLENHFIAVNQDEEYLIASKSEIESKTISGIENNANKKQDEQQIYLQNSLKYATAKLIPDREAILSSQRFTAVIQKLSEIAFLGSEINKTLKAFKKEVASDIYSKFCLMTNLIASQEHCCLVSIIMPVYNVEKYLKETMFSIINQNFSSWELICIDDSSSDSSPEILDNFSKIDSRISVIHLAENKGAGYARNVGLSKAKGKYLSILDADDIYDQNYLRNMVYSALNTGADITVCRSKKMIEADNDKIEPMSWSIKKDLLPKSKIFRPYNCKDYIFQAFVGWSWDKLYKKSFVIENQLRFQEIRFSNDAYFVYLSLCLATTISTIEDTLVIHRYHNSSLAATRKVQPSCFSLAIRAIYERLKNRGTWLDFLQSFLNWVIDFSFWHYSTIDEECKVEILTEFKKLVKDLNILENLDEIYNENTFKWIIDNNIQIANIPFVSIIVPLFNQENYLRECLDSLINQTLNNIEIIIVNDGSTDNSLAIAQEYSQNDKRIKLINKENSGYGDTMNIGIETATGLYLGIVEPDDFIDLTMYDELFRKARCKNLDFIKSDFYRFVRGEDGEYKFDYIKLDKSDKYYNKVLKPEHNLDVFRLVMNTWTGIYKTGFIKKYNIKHNVTPGASFQDNGFWFQTFCHADRGYFYNKAFYKNRRDNINSSVKSKGKVYSFSEEYHFIHNFINSLEPIRKEKFLKPFFLKLFHNYNFNLCRIDESFREEFAKFASDEFKSYINNNEFNTSMYSKSEKDRIQTLIYNYKEFLHNESYK